MVLVIKNPPANAGGVRNLGSISGLQGFPGGQHGSLLQDSCRENPMDRGAWRDAVRGVAESHPTKVTEHTPLWVHLDHWK